MYLSIMKNPLQNLKNIFETCLLSICHNCWPTFSLLHADLNIKHHFVERGPQHKQLIMTHSWIASPENIHEIFDRICLMTFIMTTDIMSFVYDALTTISIMKHCTSKRHVSTMSRHPQHACIPIITRTFVRDPILLRDLNLVLLRSSHLHKSLMFIFFIKQSYVLKVSMAPKNSQ